VEATYTENFYFYLLSLETKSCEKTIFRLSILNKEAKFYREDGRARLIVHIQLIENVELYITHENLPTEFKY